MKKRKKRNATVPAIHSQYVEPDVAVKAPVVEPVLTPDELFAKRWLANEIPDSFGNFANGVNRSTIDGNTVTALGPPRASWYEPATEKPMMGESPHRAPQMRGSDGQVLSADHPEHPLNLRHHPQKPKPPLPDSLRKRKQDQRNISRSFWYSFGYSR